MPGREAKAEVLVLAGEHTQHICWSAACRMDLYHAKYAMMPMAWSVTPGPGCDGVFDVLTGSHSAAGKSRFDPGTSCIDGRYGVGTVFSSTNAFGTPETATITALAYPTKVAFSGSGCQMIWTCRAVDPANPFAGTMLGFAMIGPNMGLFQSHVATMVNKMQAFLTANAASVLAEAPATCVVAMQYQQHKKQAEYQQQMHQMQMQAQAQQMQMQAQQQQVAEQAQQQKRQQEMQQMEQQMQAQQQQMQQMMAAQQQQMQQMQMVQPMQMAQPVQMAQPMQMAPPAFGQQPQQQQQQQQQQQGGGGISGAGMAGAVVGGAALGAGIGMAAGAGAFAGAGDAIGGAAGAVGGFAGDAGDAIGGAVGGLGDAMGGMGDAVGAVGEVAGDAAGGVVQVAGAVGEFLGNLF